MGTKIVIALLVVMGIITFFAYLIDKKKAEKGKWRTKEKTLLGLSFLFGSIGGLLGLYVVRHKTKHWYFVVVNWLSFILHMMILYFAAFGFPSF